MELLSKHVLAVPAPSRFDRGLHGVHPGAYSILGMLGSLYCHDMGRVLAITWALVPYDMCSTGHPSELSEDPLLVGKLCQSTVRNDEDQVVEAEVHCQLVQILAAQSMWAVFLNKDPF